MLYFLKHINQILWGWGLVGLLLGMGIFCLFSQNAACLHSFRLLFQKKEHAGTQKQSIFRSCMTSLAAAMGTGNIVGVATALTIGGAGAIFWMWAAALCGLGLIYAENMLSCQYRRGHDAGAAAYLRYGLQSPLLADIFAFFCVMASFGMGNMTQSHAMAEILYASFQIPSWITGLFASLLLSMIIFGGSERIGRTASMIIPLLTGIYLLLACVILIQYRAKMIPVTAEIFRNAWGWKQAGGGISGAAVKHAISVGVRRGIFSNEAGLGSSGLLHADADSDQPEFMGLCGMLEVIADTFICCTATAYVILCTGASGQEGAALVLIAFRAGIGHFADWILPPVIALFAFCTLMGWSYCGLNAFRSLTGGKYLLYYQILFCIAAGVGAVLQMELLWTAADIANACMAYCNLPGILLLYCGKSQYLET